ncbi:helix-turn-helix domain-containing protein [Lusitaniella coriacea]|uniref:helix-turn-helix domain-containing protein n=1 Tax=Lusitaniella coriacea TaxID=1983105 RepID=UPI001D13C6CF|nr:helix-turn-helix transcriptional regulator [Lusitaniella coriacea]
MSFRLISRHRFEALVVGEKQNISGQRIRQVRLQQGIDQVELAAALNIDYGVKLEQSDISEIERQVRSVKDYELDAISKVLNIDPIWLLRGDS